MNLEEVREYCIIKPAVTESLPFNDTALVFKVAGRMFALLDLSEEQRGLTLKCDPERAIELQEHHTEVTYAYHFDKKHWIGIDLLGSVPAHLIKVWINDSYDLVVKGLPRKVREINNL